MAEKRERIIFEAVSDFRGVITDLSTIKRLQQDLLDATKAQTTSIVDANNSQKKSFEQLITANQDLAKANKAQADASIQQAKTASDSAKAQQQAVRDANNEYQALKSTMTGLVGLATSIFTISQAKSFISDIIEAKSKVDNFRNTLLSMGDSVASLDAVTAGIQRLDKNSGYTSEQLYKTATALKANSVPTVELIDKLTMLGNISALVGETKLPLIAKAYLDVRNKQILYAQEVRQFTENGVPLYDLLAKSMDKPKQAVIEMAKAHEISFAQVEKALREATEKGGIYYGAMETKAKSLQGQVSNLSASFFYGQKNLADYFENGLQKGINVIRDFIDVSLGSDKAIGRTISYITSATALWLSYKVAQITATSAMKANQVQSLVSLGTMELEDIAKKQRIANLIAEVTADATLTAELKASQIARLTNIQSLIVENEVKVVGAGVTTSLATATRGLWLAMASNPIGFLVAGIGLLVSGMMAYKAMSGEVAEVNNQEITAIRKLKIGYDAQLSAIANTTIGTEKRREEVAKMQRLYPEYIGNINLETASTAQLKNQLSLVNTLFERKIKLASVNAQVETITNQAVEIENRRADIIRKLRDGNIELSNKYMRDANFIIALKSEQAKQEIDGINSYQKEMNGLAIGVYNNLGVEAKKVFKDIEKASLNASFAQKKDAQETYHFELLNLQGQLGRGLISRKEYNKLVADANAKSRGEEVNGEKEKNQDIINNDKNKHKTRVESHALTAKQIKVIEISEMEQTIDNQKKLLKAQLDADVEAVNKKYATVKNGKIKTEEEILNLVKVYNQKVQVIEASEQRKKDIIEERRRLSEADQVSKDLVQFEKDEKKKTDKAEKVLTEWETKQEKLLSTYDEARKKKEDAQRVYDEVNTAKTATEKYNVVVKYGRKTSDEISTINVARWKKEEDLLKKQLQFYFHTYGEDSKEYKKTYEALLTLRTKILNAEGVLLEKGANEQIARYAKIYQVYTKYLSDSFKESDKVFGMIQDAFKRSKDAELKTLDSNYEMQMNALGDNYQERIKLTEQYSKRETEILTSSANKEKLIGNLRDITNAIGNSFDAQSKIYENYINKTEANAKAGISNAGNMATSVLQSVGSLVTEVLGATQKARDREFQLQQEINDATQKGYEKLKTERISLAQQTHDKAVELIKEEERIALESIDIRLSKELEILSIKNNEKLQLLDENLKRELKIHEINNAEYDKQVQAKAQGELTALQQVSDETLNNTKATLLRVLQEKERYIGLSDTLKEKELMIAKFWYDKEIEAAGDNEEKKKQLTNKYNQDVADTEKYWADYKINAQQNYAQAKLEYDASIAEAEKKAQADLELAKGDIVKKAQGDLEAERLANIEKRKEADLDIENQNNAEKLRILEEAKAKELETQQSYWQQQSEQLKSEYQIQMAINFFNEEEKKKLTEIYEAEKKALDEQSKLDIELRTKNHNKLIEEEMQRSTDDKRIIEYKYHQWVLDKNKQYEDEKQEIIDKAEKKRTDALLIAEQDRIVATNIANQSKEQVVANANDRILEADYLYQKELFDAEKKYIDLSLQLQLERTQQQAEYNKATITSNLWVGASKQVADGNIAGGLIGAFNALLNGSDYTNEIEGQRAMASNAITAQINANNSRLAPEKVSNKRKVIYNRDGSGAESGGYPDFKANPTASQGHETPIDFID